MHTESTDFGDQQGNSEAKLFPLIVVYSDGKDHKQLAKTVDECVSEFPGYIIDRRRWLHQAHPEIAQVIHDPDLVNTVSPQFIEAIHIQQQHQPTLVLLLGVEKSKEVQELLAEADEVIEVNTQGTTIKHVQQRMNERIRNFMERFDWDAKMESDVDETVRIDIADLAERVRVPCEISPYGAKRYTWRKAHIQPAITSLQERIGERTTPLHIDGMCPAFLSCAIANAFPTNDIQVSDPKVGVVSLYDSLTMKEEPRDNLIYKIDERDDYTFIDISLPVSTPGERPWFDMSEENRRSLELPEINTAKGVVLSGKLPLILFTTLARAFQKQGIEWVGVYTPQQTRDAEMISPAMKVSGSDIDYISVFPHYLETFPIETIEQTIHAIEKELGGDSADYDQLRKRLREKYERVRRGVEFQSENEHLFLKYAELMEAARKILSGLGIVLDKYAISPQEATQKLFVEAIRTLTLDTSTLEKIAAVQQKIESMQAEFIAFGMITQQMYQLSNHQLRLLDISELTLQSLRVQQDPEKSTDPGKLLDHEDAPGLWMKMQKIYRANYPENPNHAEKLLEQFPLYLQPEFNTDFTLLYFSMEKAHTCNPKDLVGFIRYSTVMPIVDDGKKYRYVGALNIDPRLHGYQLHVPLLIQTASAEFQNCDTLVLRADPRTARVYKRSLGAKETTMKFKGEFPSGDPSLLLTITKQSFESRFPQDVSYSSSS